MKTTKLHWPLAVALIGAVSVALAQTQTQTPHSDPLFVKATAQGLVQALRRNSKNPDAMVKLIRKSIESKQVDITFKTLTAMKKEQPNNAVVLSAYAMAADASIYQVRANTGTIRQSTREEEESALASLERAKRLAPKLWLPYTIEATRISSTALPSPEDRQKSLDLAQKAVNLAPKNAFARKQFAEVLQVEADNAGVWNKKPVTHRQSAKEFETALKLDPSSADTAFALFSVYDVDLKDKKGATHAKRAFLRTLPKGYNLASWAKERLALYPS